jgi:hypothetical protein
MGIQTIPKDARKAVREATKVGFVLTQGRNHFKLTAPDGHAFPISVSASDGNAAKAIIRDVRRARERCGV